MSASISSHKLDNVVEALDDVGLLEFTVSEVHSAGERPHEQHYRGVAYNALERRLLVEVIVRSPIAPLVADLIAVTTSSGPDDSGVIWTTDIDAVVDIATGDLDSTTFDHG